MKIEGFNVFSNKNWSEGRGILVYTSTKLNINEIDKDTWPSSPEYHIMDVALTGKDKLRICTIYRSPSSTVDDNDNLLQLLREIYASETSHLLIIGDFNYPLINWEANYSLAPPNSDTAKFLTTTNECLWHQHVNGPTRTRMGENPTTLDLVFTNEEGMIDTVQTASPLGKSDHCLLYFHFNCYTRRTENASLRYNYKKADKEKLRKRMKTNWDEKLKDPDVDKQWTTIKNRLLDSQEESVPKCNANWSKAKGKIPLNDKAIKTIRRKHRAWQRYIETREESKRLEYVKLRNQVKKLTRSALLDIERDIAKSVKKDPKKFWAYVNRRTKTKSTIPDLEVQDGDRTYRADDNELKAEALGKFFASVFITEPPGDTPLLGLGPQWHFRQHNVVTKEKIRKKIKKMKLGKSAGPDEISPWLLKETEEELLEPLEILFRNSITQMKLPTEWKKARVTAIHKKGPKHLCTNYRPVSLTSIIGKLLESLIRDVIMQHMIENNLLSKRQYGFLPGRSTLLQLLAVLDIWTEALDNGEDIEVIYLDFQKAFDQVPHRRLLEKLRFYGIEDPILGWIQDFLANRTQYVAVGNKVSSSANVTSGIPQGSVLGPLLFVIFINDLPDDLNTETFVFADDTKIFHKSKNIKEDPEIEQDLKSLEDWSKRWLLKFNPSKCVHMIITRQQNLDDIQRKLMDSRVGIRTVLPQAKVEKDLGVNIDDRLTFKEHIGVITKKANKILGVIRRCFTNLNKDVFVPLYTSLVRSHLEYAQAAWSPHNKGDVRKLEQIQRRATRLVNGTNGMSYSERLRFLDIPTLAHRRQRGDMIETYKMLTGIYNQKCIPKLQRSVSRTRGHQFKLFKTRTNRLDVRKFFFVNRITDEWNNLPDYVVCSPTLNTFKNRLDKHWGERKFDISSIWSDEV